MTDLSTLPKKTVGNIIPTVKNVVDLLHKTKNTEYTVQGIREANIFPWARNERTIARIIRQDMKEGNELCARIEGEGNGRRYFVKGKNIIKYIERYGPVLMRTIRKPNK